MEKKYSIEELIIDDSFINYCYNANTDDVAKWEAYINAENKATVEEAKQFVYGLSGMLQNTQLNESFQKLKSLSQNLSSEPKVKSLWTSTSRIAAAAIVILGVGSSIYFYQHKHKITRDEPQLVEEIKPGSNKAILTLANGKTIILEETKTGLISHEGNTSVNKTADGQIIYQGSTNEDSKTSFNKLEIPRGGQYQLILPDGSKVWLNSASTLIYPTSFDSKERKVELTGEAYFEVAKDKNHPFVVKTNNQEVEVLGTHFNIRSYPNETDIRTTLLEGSVRVGLWEGVNAKQITEKILKPGEQSLTRINNQSIEVQKADVQQVMGWKNGDFIFRRASLDDIMHELSRWYDIEVEYAPGIKSRTYSGLISRSKNLSAVLRMLKSTGQITFEVEGKKVKVLESI